MIIIVFENIDSSLVRLEIVYWYVKSPSETGC